MRQTGFESRLPDPCVDRNVPPDPPTREDLFRFWESQQLQPLQLSNCSEFDSASQKLLDRIMLFSEQPDP